MLRHPRTTIAGACMVLGSLLSFAAQWVATGAPPTAEAWTLLGGGLTAGAGLIAAADGKDKPK